MFKRYLNAARSIIATLPVILVPSISFAYYRPDEADIYGYGSNIFDNVFYGLLFVVASLASWVRIIGKCDDWITRRRENSGKVIPKLPTVLDEIDSKISDLSDLITAILGLFVISFLAMFPILLLIKWFGSSDLLSETWHWLLGGMMLAVAYLEIDSSRYESNLGDSEKDC